MSPCRAYAVLSGTCNMDLLEVTKQQMCMKYCSSVLYYQLQGWCWNAGHCINLWFTSNKAMPLSYFQQICCMSCLEHATHIYIQFSHCNGFLCSWPSCSIIHIWNRSAMNLKWPALPARFSDVLLRCVFASQALFNQVFIIILFTDTSIKQSCTKCGL